MAAVDNDAAEAVLPSCTGCRRRKLRCSRQTPVCSNCERLQVACSYDGQRNKPGLKGGVVDSLSQRLAQVEKAVFGQTQATHAAGHEDVTPRGSLQASLLPSDSIGALASACSNLAAELRHLGRARQDGASRSQDRFESPGTSEGQAQNSSRKRPRSDNDPDSFTAKHRQPQSSISYLEQLFTVEGFPPFPEHVLVDLMRDMVDAYFVRIHIWVPMLHELAIRSALDDSARRETLMIVLRAMTMASLRFLSIGGCRPSTEYVDALVKKLKREVLLAAMAGLQIENVQALIILAFMEIGDGNMAAAWPLIGSLTRTVEYLGLSVENDDRAARPALVPTVAALPATENWLDEEERRRVFWNVFILDRWNTSLTASDVSRRLPVDGGNWFHNKPAETPYFGIWDRSTATIRTPTAPLPTHYESSGRKTRSTAVRRLALMESRRWDGHGGDSMTNVGAFGYYIESIESLSQVTSGFLQESIGSRNPSELSSWLTRFKEIDLRLVQWKMHLPNQWKDSGMSRGNMPGVMDPNMTIANANHNISMILLHQMIAYPSADVRYLRLPSQLSAETCLDAALETTSIIQQYLRGLGPNRPVSPQMGICAFVSAKLLLVHHQYYKTRLQDQFMLIVEGLELMHRHWRAMFDEAAGELHDQRPQPSFFSQLAQQLLVLQRDMYNNPDRQLSMTGSSAELTPSVLPQPPHLVPTLGQQAQEQDPSNSQEPFRSEAPKAGQVANDKPIANNGVEQEPHNVAQFSAFSDMLMDNDFLDMDRIISFEDMMYPANLGNI
ncbi:uncharacterized protein B0I36DRAFT_298715 [Microdochium trichocladiopsis]|uniref:Zn(2)-C6 fungal-type domain-containing protein n=1 Tax=Microdochium trichocladiopsis TaxID=1682393 RepID=A0A9P8XSZ1_9PEZI|nr:uncharacterized protein B0I36DRAFT_298715 [Microdochium trichocladiopsis]KAH7016378.1 hypothetical protein B0I36DRAFT_298715 [Microdochium trichocladiopsis]